MKPGTSTAPVPAERTTFILERSCRARLERLWELWTTRAGLRSWWGPEGFRTRILTLDPRPGGEWHLTLTAHVPRQVEVLRGAGAPLCTCLRATYTEVLAPKRLRYSCMVDALRAVPPFELAVLLELYATGEEALIVVTVDAVHTAADRHQARAQWDHRLDRLTWHLACSRVRSARTR